PREAMERTEPATRGDGTAPQTDRPSADQPSAGQSSVPGSDQLRTRLTRVREEVAKAVVGQDAAVTSVVIALLVGGHVLLEGVPGVAKTLLVRSISASLSLDNARVQRSEERRVGKEGGGRASPDAERAGV